MPKPILSDSLFNADDVATAILNEANLQIANENLAVTDVSSNFVPTSANSAQTSENHCYKFNGFVFMNLYAVLDGPTSGAHELFHVNDSALYPNFVYYYNQISYQRDTSEFIEIDTNGIIRAVGINPGSGSDTAFRVFINGFYRI